MGPIRFFFLTTFSGKAGGLLINCAITCQSSPTATPFAGSQKGTLGRGTTSTPARSLKTSLRFWEGENFSENNLRCLSTLCYWTCIDRARRMSHDARRVYCKACFSLACCVYRLPRTMRRTVAGNHWPPLRVLMPSEFSAAAMVSQFPPTACRPRMLFKTSCSPSCEP
jgi:hypothetical protein